MKLNLSKFQANKLDKKQLYPISGGSSISDSKGGTTTSTGSDADTSHADQDADFY